MQNSPTWLVKLFCLAVCLLAGSAGAVVYSPSSDDYIVQVWNTDSGLPDSSVTSIAQTPDGYLWVGTLHGGLARFDGTSFVNFDPGNTSALKSIEIHKLLVDASGTLWIGNVEGGLISYRKGNFNFEYENNDTPRTWMANIVSEDQNQIEFGTALGLVLRQTQMATTNHWEIITPRTGRPAPDLFATTDGTIWYLTSDHQLGQLRGTNSVILLNPPGLASPVVTTLAKDRSGRIWVATTNHLAVWNGTTFVDQTPTNGPPDFTVNWMTPCPQGGFWVQAQSHLRKYDGQQWTVMETVLTNGVSSEWAAAAPNENFTLLFADTSGGAWFRRKHGGLGHISSTGQISWVKDTENKSLGPVQCWCEDHEGNVWVGLNDGGLARLRPRLFHAVWPQENVDSKVASSVCQDDSGAMWFGTGAKQALRWEQDAFTTFELSEVASATETKVLPASDGGLWVGSVQNGLLKLKDDQFTRPFPSQSIGTVVRCFYQDHSGALWIGNEFGLFRWDGTTLKNFGAKDGFTPADVLAITEDAAGDLWLGTALGELRCRHAGQFQTFLPKDSLTDESVLKAATTADPLEQVKRGTLTGGERFWSLRFDQDGVLWIGSLGGGLLRFQNGRFTRFTTGQGLPSAYVSQILEDDRNQLWLGTRAGIVRVDKNELNATAAGDPIRPNFVSYDCNDGLPALECSGGSQPNCWSARDGHLWFTTARGAVWMNPATLRINRLPPPVYIEDVRVDDQSLVEKSGSTLPSPARFPAKIRVAAGRHYFEFRFTALSLASPEKVRFKWRLAGLEENWVNGGGRRMASYSYIPPGRYQFEVMACNNDGIWDDQPAAVTLTVQPFYWQTWWFKLVVGLGVAAGLMVIYYVRIARLRALERLRLRIARDLHDEVGSNLGSISLLAQMMEKTPSSTDATQVHGIAVQTIDTLRDIIWFIDPKHDCLSDLVARLGETAEVMLAGIKLRFTQTGDFDSADLSLAFRRNVPPLFKEALHNVLKHAHATEVEIVVCRQEGRFEFRIEDNGTGFDPARKSSGNGLRNLRKRAAEIRGSIEITSAPGTGTVVAFSAPITQTRDWFQAGK